MNHPKEIRSAHLVRIEGHWDKEDGETTGSMMGSRICYVGGHLDAPANDLLDDANAFHFFVEGEQILGQQDGFFVTSVEDAPEEQKIEEARYALILAQEQSEEMSGIVKQSSKQ